MATLSVDAVHLVVTEVELAAVAVRPVGSVGAVVSTTQVAVAGELSTAPAAVA